MTRWGDWNARNRELLAESQRLYDGGPSPYYVEFVRRYCCSACKREIRGMQGAYFQASTGLRWCVRCHDLQEVETPIPTLTRTSYRSVNRGF